MGNKGAKSLEKILRDVKPGDQVKLVFNSASPFIGYVWSVNEINHEMGISQYPKSYRGKKEENHLVLFDVSGNMFNGLCVQGYDVVQRYKPAKRNIKTSSKPSSQPRPFFDRHEDDYGGVCRPFSSSADRELDEERTSRRSKSDEIRRQEEIDRAYDDTKEY